MAWSSEAGHRTGRPSSPRCPRPQGQEYRLRVALQGSNEIPEDRYQLTTSVRVDEQSPGGLP